ncbi:MAG: winged helix DNA-binding protein [Clostridia bacterium]|nr:winged helix DNA-binding protein [Clostridia bacterium]
MEELGEKDLSPNEIVVISSLSVTTKASEIAKISDVSKALISRSVKLLKSKDLINISLDTLDMREQTLTLTEKGEEIAKRIIKCKEKFFEKAFKDFSEDESEVLKALLNLMANNLNIDNI